MFAFPTLALAAVIYGLPGTGNDRPTAQLSAATAAMLVEWEDSRRPTDRFRFYRRLVAYGADEVTWSVSRNEEGSTRDRFIASSTDCPGLAAQMARLETLQAGPMVEPLSNAPPFITAGPALFTVWGHNRGPGEQVQTVMLSTQAGPLAEWGRETLAVIARCEGETSRP